MSWIIEKSIKSWPWAFSWGMRCGGEGLGVRGTWLWQALPLVGHVMGKSLTFSGLQFFLSVKWRCLLHNFGWACRLCSTMIIVLLPCVSFVLGSGVREYNEVLLVKGPMQSTVCSVYPHFPNASWVLGWLAWDQVHLSWVLSSGHQLSLLLQADDFPFT
jgi:hypothetical protein